MSRIPRRRGDWLSVATLLGAIVVAFWFVTPAWSQQTLTPLPAEPAVQSADWADELAEIDRYVEQVRKDWKVPGLAIAIVKDGQVLMARGYGVRELGSTDAVDAETRFAIASNSKAFTTACLAMLVDEGKLAWDDPVTRYLPRFQMSSTYVTQEITVRDLVSHRSGLDTFSGDLLWYDTDYSADEIIQRISRLKPVSSFRSRYGYQNLMYIAAGKVIEKVSGKSWAEFVQTRILDPLEMKGTTTSVDDLVENYALPHNESGGAGLRTLPLGNVDNCWGACGVNSSAADLARWMQMLLARGQWEGQSLISREQVWELWQPCTLIPISAAAAEREPSQHFSGYGLGFFLTDRHGRKIVSHGGGLDGMISQLALVPKENLGVVVLTNSESSASRFIRDRVLECFLGVSPRSDASREALQRQAATDEAAARKAAATAAARIPDTQPTLPLENYAGRYRCPLYGDAVVEQNGDRLVLKLLPASNFVADLEHWHYNRFRIRWRDSVKYNFPEGFVDFTIDGQGRTDRLIIDQPNRDFWFYELDLRRVPQPPADPPKGD